MPELHQFPLVTSGGRRGRVFRTSRFLDRSENSRIVFDDGAELTVPSEAVRPQPDGTFLLDESVLERGAATTVTSEAPHIADEHPVQSSANGAAERAVTIDEPLFYEEADVERVPVNRIVDGPVETRQEGDVTIVPVVEEVVTVQRRLLLKEEVRIRRRRTEVREPRRIVVQDGETRVFGADGRPIQI